MDEDYTESFPFYAPYLSLSKIYKWIFIFLDSLLVFYIITPIIQAELTIVALLRFLQCLVLYLKNSLKEVFDKTPVDKDIIRQWIDNYSNVLR